MNMRIIVALVLCTFVSLGQSFTSPTALKTHAFIDNCYRQRTRQMDLSMNANESNSDFWEAQKKLAQSLSEDVDDNGDTVFQL